MILTSKMIMSNLLRSFCALAVSSAFIMTAGASVSVSNYPLALLSNAVTKGSEPAGVLLEKGDVGHHGSLSPSKVKMVKDSRFVVWFGSQLEQNLVNTLSQAPNAISLYQMNAFHRLPMRDIQGAPKADTLDPHFWLDPKNAKAIVRALVVIHSHDNPKNAQLYQKNAQEFAKRMDEAVANLPKTAKKPYWAYHDSFQYLEKSLNLSFAGALTPDHHIAPKASQIKYLSDNRPNKTMCLLSQGPVSAGIANKLGNVSVVVLQEDLSDATDFVDAWQKSAKEIYTCAKE